MEASCKSPRCAALTCERPDAQDVFRGTLRYSGWSGLMADFRDMGLTDATSPLPQAASAAAAWNRSAALRLQPRKRLLHKRSVCLPR